MGDFVVIRNRQFLDAIPEFHPNAQMLKEATVAILVCGDTRLEKYPDLGARLFCSHRKYFTGSA